MAGAEALFPNENFADVIEYARSLSLPMTLHAGEALGAESVYSAIEYGANRIGHGVRSYTDAELLKIIREKNIALELCPTSNLNTRVFDSLAEYPIRTFINENILITINTDNISVSATTLADEYQKIADIFGLSDEELFALSLNSARATFLPEDEKNALVQEVKNALVK